jgi:hypothetical protein
MDSQETQIALDEARRKYCNAQRKWNRFKIDEAYENMESSKHNYEMGLITSRELLKQIIEIAKDSAKELEDVSDYDAGMAEKPRR